MYYKKSQIEKKSDGKGQMGSSCPYENKWDGKESDEKSQTETKSNAKKLDEKSQLDESRVKLNLFIWIGWSDTFELSTKSL